MDNTLYSQHLEDEERDNDQEADGPGARQDEERHNDQDATDPRQDIKHAGTVTIRTITAKTITAKTITAKNITT